MYPEGLCNQCEYTVGRTSLPCNLVYSQRFVVYFVIARGLYRKAN